MNVTTLVGASFLTFLPYGYSSLFSLHSQNEKQDSEMMAVRTADKLLKVNLPSCLFIFLCCFSNCCHFFYEVFI